MRISPHFSGTAKGLRDNQAIPQSKMASTELRTSQASRIVLPAIGTDTSQISPYPKEQLDWIRDQLSRCQYGWAWDWTKPLARVPIKQFPDGLQLDHKVPKVKPGQTLSGDCLSLSEQLGNQLAERFQEEYRFYVAEGNFTNSPWESHFFIVGWPIKQDKQNRQQMGESLGSIPNQSLIIDPSYGLMGIKGQGSSSEQLNRYSVETSIHDIARLTPLPMTDNPKSRHKSTVKHHLLLYRPANREKEQKSPCTSGLPLGYMSKLVPQSIGKQSEKSPKTSNELAILYFEKRGARKAPKVIVSVVDATDGEKPAKIYRDWRREFPRFSPLHASLSNLERTLKHNPLSLLCNIKSRFGPKLHTQNSEKMPPAHLRNSGTVKPGQESEPESETQPPRNPFSPTKNITQALDPLEPASVRLRQILRRADEPAEPE